MLIIIQLRSMAELLYPKNISLRPINKCPSRFFQNKKNKFFQTVMVSPYWLSCIHNFTIQLPVWRYLVINCTLHISSVVIFQWRLIWRPRWPDSWTFSLNQPVWHIFRFVITLLIKFRGAPYNWNHILALIWSGI